jgi:hypothetical protein
LRVGARWRREATPCERVLIEIGAIERSAFGRVGQLEIVGLDRDVEAAGAQDASRGDEPVFGFDLERNRIDVAERIELHEEVEALA